MSLRLCCDIERQGPCSSKFLLLFQATSPLTTRTTASEPTLRPAATSSWNRTAETRMRWTMNFLKPVCCLLLIWFVWMAPICIWQWRRWLFHPLLPAVAQADVKEWTTRLHLGWQSKTFYILPWTNWLFINELTLLSAGCCGPLNIPIFYQRFQSSLLKTLNTCKVSELVWAVLL